MRRSGLGVALFIIVMLTTALVGVMVLGNQWFGAAFVPADFVAWLETIGLPPLSIAADSLKDILTGNGVSLQAAEQTTTLILPIVAFEIVTLLIGLVFYTFSGRRGRQPDWIDGLTAGVVLAAGMIFVSLAAGSSNLPDAINIIWLSLLALGWGLSLMVALARTMTPVTAELPAIVAPTLPGEDVPPEAIIEDETLAEEDLLTDSPFTNGADLPVMDRRQFLLRFGAGTAAIAAASATAGSALAYQSAAAEQPRLPIPMAAPGFLEARRDLLGRFRRFVILQDQTNEPEGSNVLALGTEYPDRDYVSVWIGDRSPIIIYESIETAQAAFSNETTSVSIYWLDS